MTRDDDVVKVGIVAVIIVCAGIVSGYWVWLTGLASAFWFLLLITMIPLLLGIILERHRLLLALCYNVSLYLSVMYIAYSWRIGHGMVIPTESRVELYVSAIVLGCAFVSLLPSVVKWLIKESRNTAA
jgi:hypothetical protein